MLNKNEVNYQPFLSVCIPAYNRPGYLHDLLETIITQDYINYEVVVADDNSPLADEIQKVVESFQNNPRGIKVRYCRNEETLGYDGNFRNLIELAEGDYCVYSGDDDLLCEGALTRIANVIRKNQDIGVIIRCWARAERESRNIVEYYRYFDGDRVFEPGRETVATFFRRSVQIAGFTINRREAQKYATSRFDGTLLYQLYLSGMVTYTNGGYYISSLIAIMRKDSELKPTHFFGTAKAEKGRFQPGVLSTDTSLNFVGGMLEIARYLAEYHEDLPLYQRLLKDLGNYSYPLLSVQRDKPVREYIKYFFKLKKLGFNKNLYLYIYFLLLLLLGRKYSEAVIVIIKKSLGKTPAIGGLYQGKSLH